MRLGEKFEIVKADKGKQAGWLFPMSNLTGAVIFLYKNQHQHRVSSWSAFTSLWGSWDPKKGYFLTQPFWKGNTSPITGIQMNEVAYSV